MPDPTPPHEHQRAATERHRSRGSGRSRVVLLAAATVVAAAAVLFGAATGGAPDRGTPTGSGDASPAIDAHPFVAGGGRATIHGAATMRSTHDTPGPVGGLATVTASKGQGHCATLVPAADSSSLWGFCAGWDPRLVRVDATTLEVTGHMAMPERATGAHPFSGGSYFYVDERDRLVIPTGDHHIRVVADTGASGADAFAEVDSFDLSGLVHRSDSIIAVLPDTDGRMWVATADGGLVIIDPTTRATQLVEFDDEQFSNTLAAGPDGSIYAVSNRALYRLRSSADLVPEVVWRAEYAHGEATKFGQMDGGSGTTPTVFTHPQDGSVLVAITDNAFPRMNVVIYRADGGDDARVLCEVPVFGADESATENSLIATPRGVVVTNNYGYRGPATPAAELPGGIARIDVDGDRCREVWTVDERSPNAVAKLSEADGHIYFYGLDDDGWYVGALDFVSGDLVETWRTGTGPDFDSLYASLLIGRDGRAHIGTMGAILTVQPSATRTGTGG